MESSDPLRVSDVFVPGGFPVHTYVPRDELQLEEKVADYLDERYKVLSLSGPTKSGKTVLVRRVAPDALWVSGGEIETASDFWTLLVDKLDGWIEVEKSRSKSAGQEQSAAPASRVAFRSEGSRRVGKGLNVVGRARPHRPDVTDLHDRSLRICSLRRGPSS